MKNKKIWQKTTIVWHLDIGGSGVETNIPVTDWHDKSETHFHKINSLSIVSLKERDENGKRQALMETQIFRVSIGPTIAKNEIISKLMRFDSGITGVKDTNNYSGFIVRYSLENGESFCDSAIKKAQALFEAFGVKDEKKYRISDFLTFQETLFLHKGKPIPFADYLRAKHDLPQVCTLWGRKIKVGDIVFSMRYDKTPSDIMRID